MVRGRLRRGRRRTSTPAIPTGSEHELWTLRRLPARPTGTGCRRCTATGPPPRRVCGALVGERRGRRHRARPARAARAGPAAGPARRRRRARGAGRGPSTTPSAPTACYELVPAAARRDRARLADRTGPRAAARGGRDARRAHGRRRPPSAQRGELLRWRRRLGEPRRAVRTVARTSSPRASAATGGGRAAVGGDRRPVRRGRSSSPTPATPSPTLDALAILDGLGARPAAAALARQRLRALGRHRDPARPAARHPREPGRAHRPPGRDPAPARRRPHQRRDRGAARAVGAHGRPPRRLAVTRSETRRHENGDSPSGKRRLAVSDCATRRWRVRRASRSPCGRRTGTGRRGRPSASTRRAARPRPRPAGARAAGGARSRCPTARR